MNELALHTALHRDADLVGEPSPDLLDQLVRRRRRQRRQRAGLLATAAAVVVMGAGVPVVSSIAMRSDVAPATQPTPSTPPATTEVAPTTSAMPTTSATPVPSSSADPTTAPVSTSPEPAGLILGPDGLGSLKLGMSPSEAEASGMVEPFRNEPNSDTCFWRSRLSDAPAGSGTVFHSDTLGVATIDAYEGVQTPEGVGIGSSLAAVAQAYGDFQEDEHLQRSTVSVPGNSEVVYRIAYSDGEVTELTLQYAFHGCYE